MSSRILNVLCQRNSADPRLGRHAELLAETPLQRALVAPGMRRKALHAKAVLRDNNPKLVPSE
jgi:hypothetical protein